MYDIVVRFVNPVYGCLMGNIDIWNLPEPEKGKFIADFGNTCSIATDDVINSLLVHENWRASLVGAWVAFANNRYELRNKISELLTRGRAGMVGYCYALAKMGGAEESEVITQYLEKELSFDRLPVERFQKVAVCALLYLDKTNGTEYAKSILKNGGPYERFISLEFLPGKSFSNDERWRNIEIPFEHFCRTFDFINNTFSANSN